MILIMKKLIRLFLPLFLFLSGLFSPTWSIADHHICGLSQCVALTKVDSTTVGTPDVAPGVIQNADFGSIPAGTSTTKTLTFGVTGTNFPVYLTSIARTGTNATEFNQGTSTCTFGVTGPGMSKNQTCTVQINFNPSSDGIKNASLLITAGDGSNPVVMTRTTKLTGTATLPAPVITSGLAASGTIGATFSYQIIASYNPISYAALNLPPGLTIDTNTGLISGNPTTNGTFNTTISATNATGTGTETLVITISAGAPVITSASTSAGTTGQAFNYQITATNSPTSYNATALPTGLSVNTTTGLISGTPTAGGTYDASISATNAVGTANQPLTITIASVVPVAQDTTLNVPLNTPTTIDLAPFITGPAISGVRVVTAPTNGQTTTSGTAVTYTPVNDYFGPDSFTYVAFNNDGDSNEATVTVSVEGRPDPSKDLTVGGLVRSQLDTGKRFSRSQISNFKRRMETLHQRRDTSPQNAEFQSALNNGKSRANGLDSALKRYAQSNRNSATDDGLNLPDHEISTTFITPSFINTIASAVSTRSLDLSYTANAADNGFSWLPESVNIWVGGNVRFGSRDRTSDSESMRISTDGISIGIDNRFTDSLALGVGIGYAEGKTKVGDERTRNDSTGSSITFYGSYSPTANTFIDGLIGYGDIDHDMERYVASIDSVASADRDAEHLFGSIAAGYEFRRPGFLFSPYVRLDFSEDDLDQASETGAGTNNLTYFDESVTTGQLSLGFRAESQHKIRFGWAQPYLRLELSNNFGEDFDSTMAYNDQLIVGPRYTLRTDGEDSDSILFGVGSDFLFRDGLKFGIDYQISYYDGPEHDQAIGLWLSKSFDDNNNNFLGLSDSKLFDIPISLQAGYTRDDNLNRVTDDFKELSDQIYTLNVGTRKEVPISKHTRLLVSGSLEGKRYHTYHGLDQDSIAAKAEYQYRSSGEFDAMTFGLTGSVAYDEYDSRLRSGFRYSLGINARQVLTDRISWFASLSHNKRDAENTVFDIEDDAVQLSLDYSLGRNGAIYLTSEYRDGDTVSSTPKAVYGGNRSDLDDVFPVFPINNNQYTASRFEAETKLWTIGYNLPIGSQDSLDFSWRYIKSTPETSAGGNTGKSSYRTNQYSIFYLMRF
ncbi:MAG: autotransporter domain-containing protein [Gammaproteobacteria bacterium]|nr:MAG: autotransporter domain-containing protein [Gammaproteobacteria bacterium]